jgi:hypothetical protein
MGQSTNSVQPLFWIWGSQTIDSLNSSDWLRVHSVLNSISMVHQFPSNVCDPLIKFPDLCCPPLGFILSNFLHKRDTKGIFSNNNFVLEGMKLLKCSLILRWYSYIWMSVHTFDEQMIFHPCSVCFIIYIYFAIF